MVNVFVISLRMYKFGQLPSKILWNIVSATHYYLNGNILLLFYSLLIMWYNKNVYSVEICCHTLFLGGSFHFWMIKEVWDFSY